MPTAAPSQGKFEGTQNVELTMQKRSLQRERLAQMRWALRPCHLGATLEVYAAQRS